MVVLPSVGVDSAVGWRVAVAVNVAIPVGWIRRGVTVGKGSEVSVARGTAVNDGEVGRKGKPIFRRGLNKLIICAGTNCGVNQTAPTIAKDSNSKVQNKIVSTRRPFRFLRRGLKTGNSSARTASFPFPD